MRQVNITEKTRHITAISHTGDTMFYNPNCNDFQTFEQCDLSIDCTDDDLQKAKQIIDERNYTLHSVNIHLHRELFGDMDTFTNAEKE